MLENATRICEAKFGTVGSARTVPSYCGAMHKAPPGMAQEPGASRSRRPPGQPLDRVLKTKSAVQSPIDQATYQEQIQPPSAKLGGARTHLSVPMIKEGEMIGAFAIYRQEVRPFTDKQIELVQNFAAQAVIAIENTRLLNELRQRTDDLSESLEQQTATSEVLKVISSSPGDLEPVFQSMLANATRICDAKFGNLIRFEGGAAHVVSRFNIPPELAEFYIEPRHRAGPSAQSVGRAEHTRRVVQIARHQGRSRVLELAGRSRTCRIRHPAGRADA